MMGFQCRSLLAFFMIMSTSLAKEESVTEHIQTSRHKGRSHKVTSWSQQSLTQAGAKGKGGPAERALLQAKFGIMDTGADGNLDYQELLENYDDVNSFQSTSSQQTKIFYEAMDQDVDSTGSPFAADDYFNTGPGIPGRVDAGEYAGFEMLMLEDYDDTFDAIATKKVLFLDLFNFYDKGADGTTDHFISQADWTQKNGDLGVWELADSDKDGRVEFTEFVESAEMLYQALDKSDGTSGNAITLGDFKSPFGGPASALYTEIDTSGQQPSGAPLASNGNNNIEPEEVAAWMKNCAVTGREIDDIEWNTVIAMQLYPSQSSMDLVHLDGDGDGDVDREEFMTFNTRAARELNHEFHECDTDTPKDKHLSVEEISACPSLPTMDQKFFDLLDGGSCDSGTAGCEDDDKLSYYEFMTAHSELVIDRPSYFIELARSAFNMANNQPFWTFQFPGASAFGIDFSH